MSKAQHQDADKRRAGRGSEAACETGDDKTPRPTVLQVLPALSTGGAERGAVQVAAHLVASGWRALVASAGGPLTHEIERAGAEHITLPLDRRNPLAIRRNAGRLADLIARENVDIVHARSRAPAWSAWRAARRTGRHFVTTFHGTYNFNNPLKHRYNAIMVRGERVIAISDFIAEHIRAEYTVDGSRIRVIDRGVDIDIFDPAKVTTARMLQIAERLRLPEDRPVVLMPGRLTRWKGHMVFIDALARLGRQDLRAIIMGDDQGRDGYRRALEARVRARGLESVVQFAEHCTDMSAAFMFADVVVSASTDPEAFGRVLPEAQAMGRPVIGTDHGGPRHTVLTGATDGARTGWLVPPGDPAALAAALAEALDLTPAARQALADRAIAHVRANFTRDAMCARTLAVYEELLAGRPLDG